ncbi:hypothetical protein BDP55DRAFT_638431 [Colletotrichum godetiae]|uniref:Uncharacterized protein n=1 Tax=Colletotrichum godetiae TaxID=1209918 RepID=A0AAJ0ELQ3_9PEZI|nr:uncharacterized protein BDP55DRAFT_638431 [Colletotrichum godetiae]KAK1657810.1 hypothetical protein BDP55DRAFT_638431 [Colletotrichum godetiae]
MGLYVSATRASSATQGYSMKSEVEFVKLACNITYKILEKESLPSHCLRIARFWIVRRGVAHRDLSGRAMRNLSAGNGIEKWSIPPEPAFPSTECAAAQQALPRSDVWRSSRSLLTPRDFRTPILVKWAGTIYGMRSGRQPRRSGDGSFGKPLTGRSFADRGAPKWLGEAQTAQRTAEAQRAGPLALMIMSGFAGSAVDEAKEAKFWCCGCGHVKTRERLRGVDEMKVEMR